MSEDDFNTGDLANEQMERERRKLFGGRGDQSGGARNSYKDGRVSKALGWFWGIVGTGIAGAFLLAANNLYQLNVTVARAADNAIVVNQTLADHEVRLRNMEREVNTIEGRVFRGVDGYTPGADKEPKRGR